MSNDDVSKKTKDKAEWRKKRLDDREKSKEELRRLGRKA